MAIGNHLRFNLADVIAAITLPRLPGLTTGAGLSLLAGAAIAVSLLPN
jgi:hypothetical protein